MKTLINFLLPRLCVLCTFPATTTFDLCTACYQDLPRLHYVCSRCAHPFARFAERLECDYCKQFPELPFERTFSLFAYQPPVTKIIMDLKFGQALINAKLLGSLMLEKIRLDWYSQRALPELIIPIPLHPSRLKERGYNQTLEIAKALKPLNIPIAHQLCQRIKKTAAQATLIAQTREKNMAEAFILTKAVHCQHIAVVDDVITTGATIKSFCQLLKQAGVATIDVWCCARPYNLSYMMGQN